MRDRYTPPMKSTPTPNWKKGQIVRRLEEIHKVYGGNRQVGISVPVDSPYIFIFSGSSGKKHGYIDGWQGDGCFYYTGEGQRGNMNNNSPGNKAIIYHHQTKRRVFLFEFVAKGLWKFQGELRLVDFTTQNGIDTDKVPREMIIFKFQPIEVDGVNYLLEATDSTMLGISPPDRTEREGLVLSRVGQGLYRKMLQFKWNNRCAVTQVDEQKVLIASHIVPWKDSTDSERLDPENGILLSPNLDALFDKHLISFNNNKKIIISNSLSSFNTQALGIYPDMQLVDITSGMKPFLERHRESMKM